MSGNTANDGVPLNSVRPAIDDPSIEGGSVHACLNASASPHESANSRQQRRPALDGRAIGRDGASPAFQPASGPATAAISLITNGRNSGSAKRSARRSDLALLDPYDGSARGGKKAAGRDRRREAGDGKLFATGRRNPTL